MGVRYLRVYAARVCFPDFWSFLSYRAMDIKKEGGGGGTLDNQNF